MTTREGSVVSAMGWMSILSLLLFWIPGVGGFVAGFVGGRKAVTVGKAIVATFLPAVIIAILIFFITSVLSGVAVIGAVAGGGAFLLGIAHIGPMLLGAIIGAATA